MNSLQEKNLNNLQENMIHLLIK